MSSTFAREPWLAHPAGVRHPDRRSARCSCGSTRIAFGEPRGPTARGEGLLCADVRASRARVRRRHLPAAGAGRLVPERREAARDRRMATLTDIDRRAQGREATGRGRASSSTRTAGASLISSSRPALDAARPVGRCRRGAHGAARRGAARDRRRHARMPGRTLSLGRRAASAGDPARARHPRSLWPASRSARRTRGPGSISASGACSIRSATRRERRSARAPYRVPAGRGRGPAPDSGRSGACRHHRARAISASPPMARRWCGSSSGSAMCTRASSR